MKNRWLLSLSVFFLMMVCIQSYALAPGIKTDFPDIVIGSIEDNVGFTIDQHFYRFPDALNLDDFVIDWDTNKTDLKWSFKEEDGNNLIEINGVTQISDASEALDPPSGKIINETVNLLSIRDIQASPHSEDPGPYSGPLTSNRLITLFVSDGVNVDYKTIQVSSVAGSSDQLVPVSSAPQLTYDFVNPSPNPWDWFSGGIAPGGGASTMSFQFGVNGLQITENTAADWDLGIWNSPYIDFAPQTKQIASANKLYVAKFYLSTDQAIEDVPDFRVRWGTELQRNGTDTLFKSTGSRLNTLTGAVGSFKAYFQPTVDDRLYLAVDMINAPATSGNLFMNEVEIIEMDPPTGGRGAASFAAGQFGTWISGSAPGYNPPVFTRTPGGTLQTSSTLEDVNTFGYWQTPGDTITYWPEKLYKVAVGLKTSDDTKRNNVPHVRMRAQAEDNQFSAIYHIYPDGNGEAMPTEAGKVYSLWFQTPSVAQNPDATADGFIVAVDHCDFDSLMQGSDVEIYSVDVEFFNQPNF